MLTHLRHSIFARTQDKSRIAGKIISSSECHFEFPISAIHRYLTRPDSYREFIVQEVEFTYDVFDRRIAKTVDDDGAGPNSAVTVTTVYDGEHAWADFDASEDVLARYLFGDRIDEIIARWTPGDGTGWYLTDHLGTVRDIVDDAGDLINTITYDSFGGIVVQTNAAAGDRFTYTGREYDAELGLYYYRARYYSPSLGRFISQDPIGFGAGDANLYRYTGNAPVNRADPLGLDWLDNAANFSAGFADSLTMGVTSLIRGYAGIDGQVDYGSGYYIVGEGAETAGEILATGGLAAGKKAGQKFALEVGEQGLERLRRQAVRQARSQRKAAGKPHVASEIGQGHHKYPVKEGKFARPQRAGDPSNIEFLHGNAKTPGTPHNKAHRKLDLLEKLDDARDATLGTRQGISELNRRNKEDGGESRKC